MIRFLLLAGVLFAGSFSLRAQTTWGELSIIGNKTGLTQLKAQEARNIFRANTTTWPNKISVTIALPSPKSSSSEPVARLIYGTRPASVQKFWLSLVFQGRATPPNFFDTDQELIQFIQRTPGAIGVISSTTPIPATVSLIPIQN
jgi:ABC-type phosphate transport system substrate-binding protein